MRSTSRPAPEMPKAFSAGALLRDGVVVVHDEGALKFILQNSFQFKPVLKEDLSLITELKQGIGAEALRALWAARPRARRILEALLRKDVLVPFSEACASPAELERQNLWLRQFGVDAESVRARMSRLIVGILGCGGTGAVVVEHLAAMGIRRYVLIDFDRVEKSNFNRQFPYQKTDLGRLKSEALREYILARIPDAEVALETNRVDGVAAIEGIIAGHGLTDLFACADQPAGYISQWCALAAARTDCPCVCGSVGLLEGTIGPLLTTSDAKERYAAAMGKAGALAQKALLPPVMGASLAPVNTIVAAGMVLDWWLWRTGTGMAPSLECTTEWDARTGQRRMRERWDA